MRKIKFRAWDKNKKAFLDYPCYINHFDGKEFAAFDRFFNTEDEEIVFQQCTHFEDKNGKEIYEGDIVRYKEKLDEHGDVQTLEAEVFYAEEYAAFVLGKNDVWNTFHDFGISDIEVISHAFENE